MENGNEQRNWMGTNENEWENEEVTRDVTLCLCVCLFVCACFSCVTCQLPWDISCNDDPGSLIILSPAHHCSRHGLYVRAHKVLVLEQWWAGDRAVIYKTCLEYGEQGIKPRGIPWPYIALYTMDVGMSYRRNRHKQRGMPYRRNRHIQRDRHIDTYNRICTSTTTCCSPYFMTTY